MSEKRDLAKARADAQKAVLQARLDYAKRRLAPRALAAQGADAIAGHAAKITTGLKPAGRVIRTIAPIATIAALAVAVILRLKDNANASTKQPAAAPVKEQDKAPAEEVINV